MPAEKPTIPSVTFVIGDIEYRCVFDFAKLIEIEEASGLSLGELAVAMSLLSTGNVKGVKLKMILSIIAACANEPLPALQKAMPAKKVFEVFKQITPSLIKAIYDFMPETKDEASAEGNAPDAQAASAS